MLLLAAEVIQELKAIELQMIPQAPCTPMPFRQQSLPTRKILVFNELYFSHILLNTTKH